MPATRRRQQQNEQVATVSRTALPPRRGTRGQTASPKKAIKQEVNDNDESAEEDEQTTEVHVLDGVEYDTYQDMVNAKRKRNQEVLQSLGFIDVSGNTQGSNKKTASQRGIKKQKTAPEHPVQSRKSSRLSGLQTSLIALDYNVVNWNKDNSIIKVENGDGTEDNDKEDDEPQQPKFFNGRLNDGSELTLEQAIDLNDSKWIKDDSVETATRLQKDLCMLEGKQTISSLTSPISVLVKNVDWSKDVKDMVDELSIDKEEYVAKVTPDRIYSVATHPSESKLIACAGDKQGYVGLWDVDAAGENDGVHLFRVHSRPVCCLQWATGDTMISASYDGTVRRLNVERGTFEEIFATYDDSDSYYAEELGYGLDEGYRYWLQYATLDPRCQGSDPCLFLSTSVGTVLHVDLRIKEKQRITFHEKLSEKKINSLSLHPNGHALASAGLDGIVNLWDIRKFGNSYGSKTRKGPKSFANLSCGLSISSSFFSPSGNSLLTTSFANRLDLVENAHQKSNAFKPTESIQHNNRTGRWLTTFMASWHPQLDIFVSGSMRKPRCMEIFDINSQLLRSVTGESLASVMSRCCFHPSTDKLCLIGGNSSGRVVAVR